MNYMAYLNLNNLPFVFEERRVVDGQEQVCLVIPVKTNQFKKSRGGDWLLNFRLKESEPNERMESHHGSLVYRSKEAVENDRRNGRFPKRKLAWAMPLVDDRSLKLNRENKDATDIAVDGAICLDLIPDTDITYNRQANKRYCRCTFKSVNADGVQIFATGAICIDDIPKEEIVINPKTRLRNVRCRFKKEDRMDELKNTHTLVVIRPDGAEIEIGRFRQWYRNTEQQKRIAQFQSAEQAYLNPQAQKPQEQQTDNNIDIQIDGLVL